MLVETGRPPLTRAEALRRLARDVAAGIVGGLRQLGGERVDVVDHVPDWFLAGHRRKPTGRRPGRPKGAKDSYQRTYRRRNLPANT
jgi:hypothetical protein